MLLLQKTSIVVLVIVASLVATQVNSQLLNLLGPIAGFAQGFQGLFQTASQVGEAVGGVSHVVGQVANIVSSFLDRVPTDGFSRSAANRVFMDKPQYNNTKHYDLAKQHAKGYSPQGRWYHPIKKNQTKNHSVNTYDNQVKALIGAVFALHDKKCGPDTCDCNRPRKCILPPKCKPPPECTKCAPCPLPKHCLPPAPGKKCPPKPVCPVCRRNRKKTKQLSLTNTSPAPTTTTSSSTTTTTTNAPTTTSTPTTTTTTTTTTTSTTTSKPTTMAPTNVSPEIKEIVHQLFEQERTIIEKRVLVLEQKQKACNCVSIKPPCTTTMAPKTEHKDKKNNYVYHKKVSTLKNEHSIRKGNNTYHMKEHYANSSTSFALHGEYYFQKHLQTMIKNVTLRENIMKAFDRMPDLTGGKAMELGAKALNLLGDRLPSPVHGRRGVGRSFSYVGTRTCLKAIVGHVLDEYLRKECQCHVCDDHKPSLCKTCDDAHRACPKYTKKSRCPPCPKNPVCPAPDDCPTYPPCTDCESYDIEDPNYDGDEELDDVDPVHTLSAKELSPNYEQKCKSGTTCSLMSKCGVAELNPLTPKKKQTGYMVGGEDEVYGEWPHMVRIDIDNKSGMRGLCGGVLISDRHVLTAGHCVAAPMGDSRNYTRIPRKSFKIVIGDHAKDVKDKYEIERKVSSVCYSSKFNDPHGEGSRYDFSVLTLDKKVKFNKHIQPACLPYHGTQSLSKCYVIGMGITQYDKNIANMKFSQKIQKMPVRRASCWKWGIKHNDRSRHCFTKAGAKGDTCGGDSGGPVMCLDHNMRWTVQGLVSYGSETCDGSESTGWVGVYTRVNALLRQIKSDCHI